MLSFYLLFNMTLVTVAMRLFSCIIKIGILSCEVEAVEIVSVFRGLPLGLRHGETLT